MVLLTIAKKIVQKFVDHGYTAYFAGGWVRDFLMNHPSNDIDIVTNAPIEEIQKLFPKTIPVGINFGIIIVVEEGHQFEVAMFRKESGYKDGRRPDRIEAADPEEDAKRRDFTINGMFYDPLKEAIYDYVEGKKDLHLEVVRAIGNPHERFLEDRLRMIRAVRYASRFRFAIEPQTIEAILYHAEELFPAVAMERIAQEFEKMAKVSHFDEALVMLHKLNLLPVVFPALKECTVEEIEERTKYISLFPKKAPLVAKLYELFPEATLQEKLQLCEYLKLSNKDKAFTEEISYWKEAKTDYDWAHLYAKPHAEICLNILALHAQKEGFLHLHRERMNRLAPHILRIEKHKTIVSADDLIARGVLPGKRLGELLKQAEEIAINDNLFDQQAIVSRLLSNRLLS